MKDVGQEWEKTWKTIGHMVTNKHVTCHEHLLLIFGEYHQLLMGNPTIYSYEQIWLEVKPAMAISHAIWFVYGHPFHNQNPNTWVYMKIDMCIYIYYGYINLYWLYWWIWGLNQQKWGFTKMRLYWRLKGYVIGKTPGICDGNVQ